MSQFVPSFPFARVSDCPPTPTSTTPLSLEEETQPPAKSEPSIPLRKIAWPNTIEVDEDDFIPDDVSENGHLSPAHTVRSWFPGGLRASYTPMNLWPRFSTSSPSRSSVVSTDRPGRSSVTEHGRPGRGSLTDAFLHKMFGQRMSGSLGSKESSDDSSRGSPKRSSHRSAPGGRNAIRGSVLTENDKIKEQIILALEQERRVQAEKEKMNKGPAWRAVPFQIVEHKAFIGLTLGLTFYALTGDDCRLLFTHAPADYAFDVLTTISLVIFFVEIVLSCFAKPDYMGGFFFILDVISTVTLVLDITTVNDALFQADDGDLSQVKSSKSARVGARAARVVRVLRLVRILKLYKTVYEARQRAAKRAAKEKQRDYDAWEDDLGDDFQTLQESLAIESNVGKKLSDLTTRRCVVLILAMMLVYPLLAPTADLYGNSGSYGADIIFAAFDAFVAERTRKWLYAEEMLSYIYFHNWYSRSAPCSTGDFCSSDHDRHLIWFGIASRSAHLARQHSRLAKIGESAVEVWEQEVQARGPTIYEYGIMPGAVRSAIGGDWNTECWSENREYLRIGVPLLTLDTDYPVDCPDQLRKVERSLEIARLISEAKHEQYHFVFYFDIRPVVRTESERSLLTTLFIVVVLVGASMMFAQDAELYVVRPVEDMMFKINLIRINPLIAATLTDEAFKRETKNKLNQERLEANVWRKRQLQLQRLASCHRGQDEKPAETIILEKTIIKLGTLLAIGFGMAGMDIVSTNLQGQDSSGIDAMIDGSIVNCFIGYARIGNFSTFTEALQGHVMTFVNQVAEIIHGVVDQHRGSPSVNNGDIFVLVWRERAVAEENLGVADMAASSLALIVAGLTKSRTLASWSSNPKVQQRLGSQSRVVVTFGFHYGWAIEGALGSEFKIDPSYISPSTSIAATAEKATHTYGTTIFVTETAHHMFSQKMAEQCRLIDKVKVKGQAQPIRLYTIDLQSSVLSLDEHTELKWSLRQRFRARQCIEVEKVARFADKNYASTVFEQQADVVLMREPYTVEFRELFSMAYQNYSEGEWFCAERLFMNALYVLGFVDGPSLALLRFMEDRGWEAPASWKGHHLLEDMPPPDPEQTARFAQVLAESAKSFDFAKTRYSETRRSRADTASTDTYYPPAVVVYAPRPMSEPEPPEGNPFDGGIRLHFESPAASSGS